MTVAWTATALYDAINDRARETADQHRETFHRSMLEAWEVDTEGLNREAVADLHSKVYNARVESGFDLDSEGWEAVDWNEGWEHGFYACLAVVRRVIGGADRDDIELHRDIGRAGPPI